MSKREIMFLNSLLLEDDEPGEPTANTCPDPTIFWSLTQKNQAGSPMVAELQDHIAKCPSCKELAGRLQAFHRAITDEQPAEPEAEWAKAAPRLDRRMHAYLKSQADEQPQQKKILRFPALRWTLPLALAGCAASVAVFSVMLNRSAPLLQPSHNNQVASTAPRNADAGHPPPVALGNDRDILTSESRALEADQPPGREPDTLAFHSGEHFKLVLTSAELQPDGSYRFTSTLLAAAGNEDKGSFDSVEVTGVWKKGEQQDRPTISIQEAVEGSARYRSSMGGPVAQTAAVLSQDGSSALLVGQTFEVEILQGGTLQKERP
jgi:hypothetical protein